MSIIGGAARLAGKGIKWGASKAIEKTVTKRKEALAGKAMEFAENHPKLVKSGQLTAEGARKFAQTLKRQDCPCECGGKVNPTHVAKMLED